MADSYVSLPASGGNTLLNSSAAGTVVGQPLTWDGDDYQPGTFLAVAANSAGVGMIRAANNTTIMAARNAANNANIALCATSAANVVTWGDTGFRQDIKGTVVQVTASSYFEVNGQFNTRYADAYFNDGAGTPAVKVSAVSAGASAVEGASTVTSMTFGVIATAVNSATGADAKIKAQNATGTTTNGGSVVLDIGTGTSANGTLKLVNATTATTVGAAGGGAALPATPEGYLSVTINGTARKIPFYAV